MKNRNLNELMFFYKLAQIAGKTNFIYFSSHKDFRKEWKIHFHN